MNTDYGMREVSIPFVPGEGTFHSTIIVEADGPDQDSSTCHRTGLDGSMMLVISDDPTSATYVDMRQGRELSGGRNTLIRHALTIPPEGEKALLAAFDGLRVEPDELGVGDDTYQIACDVPTVPHATNWIPSLQSIGSTVRGQEAGADTRLTIAASFDSAQGFTEPIGVSMEHVATNGSGSHAESNFQLSVPTLQDTLAVFRQKHAQPRVEDEIEYRD